MKKYLLIVLIILLIPFISYGEEGALDYVIPDQVDKINPINIDNLLKEVLEENQLNLRISTKEVITKLIKGEKIINSKAIFKSFTKIFFGELNTSLVLLSKILIITLISGILTNMQNTFENSSISQLANYVTYILIAILVITSFSQIMDMVKITVDRMISFMQMILPILLTLLVLTGGPNTKIIFHPMILATVNIVGVIIKSVIFPLVYFSFIVSILSNLSDRVELGKLSELGRQIITFIITGVFTIFMGILTIYGLSTRVDGITIRTARFAVERFVPIVGGFLSDAVDAVVGSSAILKNGIGVVGLLILALMILIPIIKITTLLIVYSFIGAIIEPIASPNIVQFFSDISKTILLVLISMVSIGIMFFITITIIVDTGNSMMMLR